MIFISYSTDPRVDALHADLRRHGLRVWQDKEALGSGERTEEAIRAALAHCDAAIVWIGGETLASAYVCNKELPIIFEESRRRGLRIVPLFVDYGARGGIERVREATGLDIGNHKGHVLGEHTITEFFRTVSASELREHLKFRRQLRDRPVLRLVTRSNGAPGRDEADIDIDWTIEYPDTGELPDQGTVELLRGALASVAAVVLEMFGAGDVNMILKCHLHIGVALGFAFRRVTGARPCVEVAGEWWPIEAVEVSASDGLIEQQPDTGPPDATHSAIELSISRQVTNAVSEFIKETGTAYRRRMFLAPTNGPTQTGVTAAANNAWAERAANRVRELRQEPGMEGVDLFIAAPIAFAVGLGWRLNAVRGARIYHPEGNGGPYHHAWTLPDS